MGCCGSCSNFVACSGYHLIYDGYCTMLRKGDSYKGVNRSNSCNYYSGERTASNSGFDGGCFLTSACVEYLGKQDDCKELTLLRNFRDTYMKTTESGNKLVKEYYEIAPKIVEFINASDKKEEYYEYINGVIKTCVELIELNENERVLEEYKTMVLNLKEKIGL